MSIYTLVIIKIYDRKNKSENELNLNNISEEPRRPKIGSRIGLKLFNRDIRVVRNLDIVPNQTKKRYNKSSVFLFHR